MRAVVLAGGLGSRLYPLTLANNKHLLPIYNKPMIFYPIEAMVKAGIQEIMLVVSGPFAGNFIPLLKNGEDFGLKKLVYAFQSKPDGGIADALALAEDFADNSPIAVTLGDNSSDTDISSIVSEFEKKCQNTNQPIAQVFLKQVPDPEKFGVAKLENDTITEIKEKPSDPASNWAVTGLYLYDKNVFSFIRECSPSHRGELEITDLNNLYIQKGKLYWSELEGFWKDAGSFDSLIESNLYWYNKSKENNPEST